jgi:hypothetical protein
MKVTMETEGFWDYIIEETKNAISPTLRRRQLMLEESIALTTVDEDEGNRYSDDETIERQIKNGTIAKGSVVKLFYPSGNSRCVRVHGYDSDRGVMLGCCMCWDNAISEEFKLDEVMVELVDLAREADR